MTKLDRSRPYGEIWNSVGLSGFAQDNREFDINGVSTDPEPVAKPKAGAKTAAKTDHPPPAGGTAAAPDDAAAELAKLPDEDLKPMVEIAGGTWTDRKAALAFLGDNSD